MDIYAKSKSILIIHHEDILEKDLKNYIDSLKSKVTGQISTKNHVEICKSNEFGEQYDLVLSGFIAPYINHDNNLIAVVMKLLNPQGVFSLYQPAGDQLANIDEFMLSVLINGFSKVDDKKSIELKDDAKNTLKKQYGNVELYELCYRKPGFTIGSSVTLNIASKKSDNIANVWKIDNGDDDEETIDPDNLLDEDDLKKPDPSSLKVCGTTGKRKACKDCSCGLAEELQAEEIGKKPEPVQKSSCGSCYLGDAFRCASCPYLGMPAFKPGEKIQLSSNQLEADL